MLCMSDLNKQSKKKLNFPVFARLMQIICLKLAFSDGLSNNFTSLALHLGRKDNQSHFENIYDPERFISTEPS